jgi:Ca2+-binding EF-hand superfamily protein
MSTSVIVVEKAQGNDLQSIELGRRMPGTRYDVPELRDFTMSQNDFSSLETAVRAMNEQGVFHTDLKNRSNIFVHHDEQGRTHFSLIDWGGPHDAGMRQNDIEALSAGRDALLANGILSESTVAPQQAIKLPTEQERAAAASMWGDIARQYAPETIERRSDGSVGAGMRSSAQGPQADVAQTAPAASENWDYGAKPGELTDKFGRPLRTDSRTGKPADPIAGGRALWEQRMAEADEVARRTAEGEARTTPVERPVTPPTAQVEVHPTHTVPAAVAAAAVGASTADTAATVGRGGHAGDAHVRTVHGISTGVGAALGVYGLSQKVGRDGTLQSDLKAGGAQAGLAIASTVGDTTAIAADTVGMLRGSGAVGAVARRAALPVAVVAGALETGTAIAARDGHRAATAAGATAGGILGGMAAGAATGLVLGSVVPGAGNVVGAVVGGVVGLAGGLVGAYYGGKAADAVAGAALDQRLNADIDTPLNAMAGQLQRLGYTKMLDKDGDGKIEAHEVRQFLGADGVRDLRASARNGLALSEVTSEIKQQLTENYGQEMKNLIAEAKQKGWTKRLDANHDGKLDMSDVRANLAKTGVRLDANLDGHISGGEFIRAQTTPAKPAQAATTGHGHR